MTDLRLRSAGSRVDLVGTHLLSPAVVAIVRGVVGQLETPATDRSGAATQVVVGLDGDTVANTHLPGDPDLAAALVVAALDRALLAATSCLTLHAAVLAGPRGAVLVPAVSGAGKSTLAAAAQQAGLILVSDEAACLDPDRDVIWPHPRPLGLDERSRFLLGLPAPDTGPPDGERATSPLLLGRAADTAIPVTPVALVIPSRVDRPVTVEMVVASAATGLSALLASCLNIGYDRSWTPARAWARLTGLVGTLQVRQMRFTTPQQGAEALASLVG